MIDAYLHLVIKDVEDELPHIADLRGFVAVLVEEYLPIHRRLQDDDPLAIIDLVNWEKEVNLDWEFDPNNKQQVLGVTPEASKQFIRKLAKILNSLGEELINIAVDWNEERNLQRMFAMMGGITSYLEQLPPYLDVLNMMAQNDPQVTTALEHLLQEKQAVS
jgi:hypothetical protein